MKEAAGEANMTVITIVLIGVVLTVGTIIVRNLMNSVSDKSTCMSCGGEWRSGKCYITGGTGSADVINLSSCQ